MSHVEISLIRIDGGTQSRAELNEAVVAEYADAIANGATFPPVSLFFDGNTYWLADGFHRYFAAKKAGLVEIEADVTEGGRREAVLHSLGANANHGLRRSNADKRKAVETLLADAEWAQMSNRQAAKVCGVSDMFVASIRSPEVKTRQQENREKSMAGKVEAPSPTIQVQSDCTPPASLPIAANEADDDFGPSEEELAAAEQEIKRNQESFDRLMASDEKMAAAAAEIKRLNNLVTVVEGQRNQYMNQASEWKRRYLKLKRETERQAA